MMLLVLSEADARLQHPKSECQDLSRIKCSLVRRGPRRGKRDWWAPGFWVRKINRRSIVPIPDSGVVFTVNVPLFLS